TCGTSTPSRTPTPRGRTRPRRCSGRCPHRPIPRRSPTRRGLKPPSRPGRGCCTRGASSSSPTRASPPSCCRRTGPDTRRGRCSTSMPPGCCRPRGASSVPSSVPQTDCPHPPAAHPGGTVTDQPVVVETAHGVRTIRLNRPDAMNSLDIATKEALRDAVVAAAEDEAVRCVVLTGSGRAFCVGQDLKEHVQLLADEAGSEQLFTTVEEHYNPIVEAVLTMPKPVIAAVNGVAAGAGASLAFAADLRIMADTAGFNLAFAGIALSCDTGASWTLPRLVGQAKALELLLMPRTVPAAEALELGLATQVVAAD